MTPISPVCSATSVDIVFEISTSAESSASTVMTLKSSANCSVSAFPGQSPGARICGRLEKPAKPGTVASRRRTASAVSVAAAGLGSSSRRANSPYPVSPLSAATVAAVA